MLSYLLKFRFFFSDICLTDTHRNSTALNSNHLLVGEDTNSQMPKKRQLSSAPLKSHTQSAPKKQTVRPHKCSLHKDLIRAAKPVAGMKGYLNETLCT